MVVVGVGYNKMLVERKEQITGNMRIKNNAQITNVEKFSMQIGGVKQDAIRFSFEFSTNYEPDLARIALEGEVVWMDKKEAIEETMKKWKKDKKIDKSIMEPVLNSALTRSNVQALILSREMNLPPPLPLPKVELKDEATGASTTTEQKA